MEKQPRATSPSIHFLQERGAHYGIYTIHPRTLLECWPPLGSASFEIEFAGEVLSGQPLRILASGDIGPDAKLLQPNPEAPTGFDYLISETTSGNTDRPPTTSQERRQRLGTHVRDASGVIRILATIIVLRGADQEDARLR